MKGLKIQQYFTYHKFDWLSPIIIKLNEYLIRGCGHLPNAVTKKIVHRLYIGTSRYLLKGCGLKMFFQI